MTIQIDFRVTLKGSLACWVLGFALSWCSLPPLWAENDIKTMNEEALRADARKVF